MQETLQLVIGNKNYSSWSLRAWLCLEQAGIPFEEIRLPLFTEQWKREIARHSPSGKVPVLRHGQRRLWDSLAIGEYLHETFSAAPGWPADPDARAVARSVSAEMHSGFQALRDRLPMNCRRRFPGFRPPSDAEQDVRRICAIWRQCRAAFGADGPWLFGQFSIADAVYAPVALRLRGYCIALGNAEDEYVRTVTALPAIRRWVAAAEQEPEIIDAYEQVG